MESMDLQELEMYRKMYGNIYYLPQDCWNIIKEYVGLSQKTIRQDFNINDEYYNKFKEYLNKNTQLGVFNKYVEVKLPLFVPMRCKYPRISKNMVCNSLQARSDMSIQEIHGNSSGRMISDLFIKNQIIWNGNNKPFTYKTNKNGVLNKKYINKNKLHEFNCNFLQKYYQPYYNYTIKRNQLLKEMKAKRKKIV